jgi:hypothetical protein
MIDPTKPMYDAEGREWVALRMPDGSVYTRANNEYTVVQPSHPDEVHFVDHKGTSFSRDGFRHFTNTPPQKDWESTYTLFNPADQSNESVQIRTGYRNGKPFAEVVQP